MSRVLALIDVMDGDHVRQSFAVHEPEAGGDASLRIGRGLDCEICLDDPHIAAEHALLQIGAEPVAQLSLLPSQNGALQGRQHYRAGSRLAWPADGLLQLGHTRLRLRHAAAALAPERHTLHAQAPRWLGLALLAGAATLLMLLTVWLGLNPGADWQAYAGPTLAMGGALLAWAGLWALLTQLFQRRFPFVLHLKRALVFIIVVIVAEWLFKGLAFVASAPWLLVPETLLPGFAGAGLVYWHAREVWPRARYVLAMFLLGGLTMWLAMSWTRQQNLQHRWREPYLSTLLPPALRAAPLRSVDTLLEDAIALRAPLAEKARVDAEGNAVDDEE